ncbi:MULTISPECIES: DUF6228 family protein [Actinomycetes]|uniref:DUF6228 family protein n=1 Tax=Actinomycetes TaxID=1760 RepID=UPI001319BF20|nr:MULTISPECIES: DUF6228 family protein [Actinomycetes]
MNPNCPHGWLPSGTEMTCLDDLEVVFRGDRVAVRFGERHAADHHLDRRLFFAVRVQAPGLDARLEHVTNYVTGRGLARFLGGLDFRGWEGERRWVNADRDLSVSATYCSGGRVKLVWTLRPWRHSVHGEWEIAATTTIEAGAEKDDLTAQLDAFLTAEGFPVESEVS